MLPFSPPRDSFRRTESASDRLRILLAVFHDPGAMSPRVQRSYLILYYYYYYSDESVGCATRVLGRGDIRFESEGIDFFIHFPCTDSYLNRGHCGCRSVLTVNSPRDASLCVAHARVDAWCVIRATAGLGETEPTAIEPLQREFRALTMISTQPLILFVLGLSDFRDCVIEIYIYFLVQFARDISRDAYAKSVKHNNVGLVISVERINNITHF